MPFGASIDGRSVASRIRPLVVVVAAAAVALATLAVPIPPAGASGDGATRGVPGSDDLPVIRAEEGQVIRLYAAVFGRDPDVGGYEYWAGRRAAGLSLGRMAEFFVDSAEYRRRFVVDADTDFVDRLYHNVLARGPDAGGLAFWLGELAGGTSRLRVLLHFSESPENIDRTGTAVPRLGAADFPAFAATERSATETELGASWRPGCPVGPADLVAIDAPFVTRSGAIGRGEVVVHRGVAATVTGFLRVLYESRTPLTSLRPAAEFGGDDDAMMAVDNTSAFNCRAVTGGTSWSRHAYGTALDVNPLRNPYVRGDVVLPPAGAEWVDRTRYDPGMLRDGDRFVTAVRAAGWRWGGDWVTLDDYQHVDTLPPR